eukprot:GHVO01010571.1.p1 GENE.GHVO01010571.1~~GHVO01010571.1.p1  ORF type:complete len:488 (+),score=66.54 GHVO01010571.1:187-1464(+)
MEHGSVQSFLAMFFIGAMLSVENRNNKWTEEMFSMNGLPRSTTSVSVNVKSTKDFIANAGDTLYIMYDAFGCSLANPRKEEEMLKFDIIAPYEDVTTLDSAATYANSIDFSLSRTTPSSKKRKLKVPIKFRQILAYSDDNHDWPLSWRLSILVARQTGCVIKWVSNYAHCMIFGFDVANCAGIMFRVFTPYCLDGHLDAGMPPQVTANSLVDDSHCIWERVERELDGVETLGGRAGSLYTHVDTKVPVVDGDMDVRDQRPGIPKTPEGWICRTVIIDGLNVCARTVAGDNKEVFIDFRRLQEIVEILRESGVRTIRAVLPRRIAKLPPDKLCGSFEHGSCLRELVEDKEIIYSSPDESEVSQPSDDYTVLKLASELHGCIISNDAYRDFQPPLRSYSDKNRIGFIFSSIGKIYFDKIHRLFTSVK